MQEGPTNPEYVELMAHRDNHPAGCRYSSWSNRLYTGFLTVFPDGSAHFSFKRHDRAAVRDWRHFQAIKNEVIGREREAVEVFPRESRLLDGANQYHLWATPPGVDVPFGYITKGPELLDRDPELERNSKGRQRPWEPGLPTGLGVKE